MRGLKVIAFAITLCACAFAESAWALYGAISAPESGATFTANANITITADAFPGTYLVPIVKVEFFAGEMLIGTDTSDPYGITWNNVSAGTYTLTVKVTDTDGNTDISDEVLVTVNPGGNAVAQVYYIVPDHLNTPRMIANHAGTAVWRWDSSEPFGNTLPNDDPDGDGVPFVFDLRFPGQFFERETNLSYNYFRDYDPATGRYVESDSLGLRAGLNTYVYVLGSPLTSIDPTGNAGPLAVLASPWVVATVGTAVFGAWAVEWLRYYGYSPPDPSYPPPTPTFDPHVDTGFMCIPKSPVPPQMTPIPDNPFLEPFPRLPGAQDSSRAPNTPTVWTSIRK